MVDQLVYKEGIFLCMRRWLLRPFWATASLLMSSIVHMLHYAGVYKLPMNLDFVLKGECLLEVAHALILLLLVHLQSVETPLADDSEDIPKLAGELTKTTPSRFCRSAGRSCS